MTRILVHEFVSGGGLANDPHGQAELMRMGLAMRDAMLADLLALPGVQVSAAACSAAPLPVTALAATELRAEPGESPLAFLARQAVLHDAAWVVAPESDGLLLQCRQAVGDARWLGGNTESLRCSSSKQATLLALQGAGVPTPRDFEPAADDVPWVVKPDDGAGAVQTQVFRQRAAARQSALQRQNLGEAVTLEPWVPGEAMSLSLMCRADGTELLSVNRQHIRVTTAGLVVFDGVSPVNTPNDPRHAALTQLARAVGRALPGLRGFAGVDLVWHAQRGAVAIEVNPRVTCAYVGLSQHLGRNLAAEVLACHGLHATEPEHAPT